MRAVGPLASPRPRSLRRFPAGVASTGRERVLGSEGRSAELEFRFSRFHLRFTTLPGSKVAVDSVVSAASFSVFKLRCVLGNRRFLWGLKWPGGCVLPSTYCLWTWGPRLAPPFPS